MPEVIEIGGFALNGLLLTSALAVFGGYLAAAWWKVLAPERRSGPWRDLTINAALIAVFIWKFGVLLRDPSILWEQPLLLLVITGTGIEASVGLACAVLYWIISSRRRKIRLLASVDALAVTAAGGLFVWNVLSAPAYRWGYAVLCALLLVLLLARRRTEGDGHAAVTTCYVLGAGGLTVSLFAEPPPWVLPAGFAGLTTMQLLLIAAGLAGAGLDLYRERVEQTEPG